MKVFFLVLVYVFNFDLIEFSAAILEKGLLLSDCSREHKSKGITQFDLLRTSAKVQA